MSYILDALKKAESERALGSVPNLHAQPAPRVAIDDKSALWRRPLPWVALALAIALAALAWLGLWRVPAPAPAPVSAVATQPVVPAAAPPVVAQVPAGNPSPAIAPTAPPPVVAPAAPRPEVPKPKAAVKPLVKEKPPAPAAPAEPPSALVAAEAQLPMLRDLPANIQREIPALAVGGYIYASKSAERSILINNRLLREGEQIAPGLTLERMLPHEAVLNYRGYRYRLPY